MGICDNRKIPKRLLTKSSDTKTDGEILIYELQIFLCVKENYSAYNKSKGYLIAKCIINETKGNEELLRDALKNINKYDEIINFCIRYFFDKNEIMKLLINFFREKAKNESDFIDELYSLINHTDSKNQSLLDYVYNILDDFEYKRFKRGNILKDISLMIKNFNAYNFYTRLKNKSHEFVINMVEHILENTPEIGIYNTIKNSSGKYHDEIIFLILDVAANFINEAETIRIIGNFLYKNY